MREVAKIYTSLIFILLYRKKSQSYLWIWKFIRYILLQHKTITFVCLKLVVSKGKEQKNVFFPLPVAVPFFIKPSVTLRSLFVITFTHFF
jgi:hypothetical protein